MDTLDLIEEYWYATQDGVMSWEVSSCQDDTCQEVEIVADLPKDERSATIKRHDRGHFILELRSGEEDSIDTAFHEETLTDGYDYVSKVWKHVVE